MNLFAGSITEMQCQTDGNLRPSVRRAQRAAVPAKSVTVLMPNESERR